MPSQDELKALWESGVPLDRAWLEFTPDNFDEFMLRALRTHPDNDRDIFEGAADKRIQERYSELKYWLPPTWEGRQAKLRGKIDLQRSYLVENLYHGELWAIGFRTLISGYDELTRVPRHFFFTDREERETRPDIYWTKAELTAGTESYFDIRVIAAPAKSAGRDRDERDAAVSSSPVGRDLSAKGRGGRTRTRDEISEAARRLWDTKPEFRTLPLKRMVGEVRAAIHGEEDRDREVVNYRSSSMKKVIAETLKPLRDPKERKKPKERE